MSRGEKTETCISIVLTIRQIGLFKTNIQNYFRLFVFQCLSVICALLVPSATSASNKFRKASVGYKMCFYL